jgi:hypothetical protein
MGDEVLCTQCTVDALIDEPRVDAAPAADLVECALCGALVDATESEEAP